MNAKSWSLVNLAVSGSGIVSQADAQIYPHATRPYDRHLWLSGTNDMHTWDVSTAGKDSFKQGLKACLSWLSLLPSQKVIAQAATGITCAGTWTATPVYGGAVGKRTSENGATATFSATGSTILIATTRQLGGGAFDITIDGTPRTRIQLNAGDTANLGESWCPQINIYSGLSAGSHTVVLTAVTSAGAYCYFDWFAGFNSISEDAPMTYLGNCLKMTAAAYAAYGGSDSVVAEYCAMQSDVVAELAAIGMHVSLCDVSPDFDPNAYTGDGLHPTTAGNAIIATSFLEDIHV
jgi:hypothetical protein